ncbi:MAG: threonine/homoserine/homoserine lactone efflux protein [Alphaproteobacteria bacterium]|jgi:threonine/homoserine/homoserine lactone efflux protein
MNTAEFFIKGLIVGFLIAAPVGPVAVMCIHRTIARGRVAGYVCGLGATSADTIFGAIAALGLGFIAGELLAYHDWLRIGGGAILVALGLRIVLSRHLTVRAEQQEAQEEREERTPSPLAASRLDYHIGNFIAAFAIMITNPITLVSFAAVFAFIDISQVTDQARWGAALIAGVFIGAGSWWTTLVLITGRFHQNVTENGLLWVNRVSGALILVCGLLLLLLPTGFSSTLAG